MWMTFNLFAIENDGERESSKVMMGSSGWIAGFATETFADIGMRNDLCFAAEVRVPPVWSPWNVY